MVNIRKKFLYRNPMATLDFHTFIYSSNWIEKNVASKYFGTIILQKLFIYNGSLRRL